MKVFRRSFEGARPGFAWEGALGFMEKLLDVGVEPACIKVTYTSIPSALVFVIYFHAVEVEG